MPPKKFYKKKNTVYRKKKTYRKRRNATTLVNRGISPLPPRYLVKMKYSEIITWSLPSAGLVSDIVFRLNSIADPNETGAGHQPYGHDTLVTLYNRYRVYGVSYRVTANPNGSSGALYVTPSNGDNASWTNRDPGLISESPRSINRQRSNDDPTVLKGFISLPKLTGQTSSQYKAEDRYQSIVNNNPTELLVLHMSAIGNTPTQIVIGQVDLIYHVEFFDPIQLGQS